MLHVFMSISVATTKVLRCAVDAKMKVADRGYGVATFAILTKDRLKTTTLAHSPGSGPNHNAHRVVLILAIRFPTGDLPPRSACKF